MTEPKEKHLFAPGHSGCPGCAPALTLRTVLDVLGKDIIVVNATGCMEIISSKYPLSAWRVPYIHSIFENSPAVASGVAAALEAKGNYHTKVVVIAGDGGLYDISFGALSGLAERNDNVLVVCYDNENYANTGIQKSGATPYGAGTTTSPVGKKISGKQSERKPLVEIMAAHNIPYSASASIGFIADLKRKVMKAKEMNGTRFIDVHAPCALGAGFDGMFSVALAKKAVQSGLWFLFEYENGEFKLNFEPKELIDPKDYLFAQKRFKHLNEEQLNHIRNQAVKNYEKMKKRAECEN
ncbi:MAG: thiamine pyrophosphate-dependent enzyme [Candidatus Diapherotrites archaeon]